MRSKRKLMEIVITLALIIGVVYIIIGLSERGARFSPKGTGPYGTKAFYLLLSEIGYNVRIENDLRRVSGQGDLMILNGRDVGTFDIEEWLRAGNYLMVLTDALQARDGSTKAFLSELDIKIKEEDAYGDSRALPDPESPYATGVSSVIAKRGSVIESSHNATIHLQGDGVVCVSQDIGSGKVIVISDLHIATNSLIGEADNIIFLTNIVHHLAPEEIIFAFPRFSTSFTLQRHDTFKLSPFFFLQNILVLALIIYSLGKRLGPPLRLSGGKERVVDQMEYVQAMAMILRKAKARKKVLEILSGDFMENEELAEEYGKLISSENTKDNAIMELLRKADEIYDE